MTILGEASQPLAQGLLMDMMSIGLSSSDCSQEASTDSDVLACSDGVLISDATC